MHAAAAIDMFGSDGSADYRRAARRLRASHANCLPRLHRSLRKLNEEHDRVTAARVPARRSIAVTVTRRETVTDFAPPPMRCGPAAEFADLVRERMEGPVLRYSQRAWLLHRAARLGIRRFDANLIIASVQHHAACAGGNVANRSDVGWNIAAVLVAVAVQALILAGFAGLVI